MQWYCAFLVVWWMGPQTFGCCCITLGRRMNTNLLSLVVAEVIFFLALRRPFGCIIHCCYFSFFNFFVFAPMHLQTVSQRKRVSEIEMKWMAEDKPTATAKHDWRMPCRRWGEWLQWKFLMCFFGIFRSFSKQSCSLLAALAQHSRSSHVSGWSRGSREIHQIS